ncbi:Calx-beta domain-containing protein [Prosthecobacter sp.]|uniref:Calx-beta domain-containing protein n=1 Tax=Prosthecobacter sp. TaxID=1965333 RepID=UPI0025CE4508|nr:Calx-beta domain-containing protein [Prosthecobacter sp.]
MKSFCFTYICFVLLVRAGSAGTVTYIYDGQDRVVSVQNGAALATYTYDAGGNLTGSALPGTVQFVGGERSTFEGVGSVTIAVERANGSDGPLSIGYATANSTATAPQDYLSTTGILNWADGETGQKSFNVSIIQDALVETPGEVMTISLSNPNPNGALAGSSYVLLKIYDQAIEIWRQLHFASPSNSGDGADLMDFDSDGLPNLLEYAFGLNPKSGISNQLPSGVFVDGKFALQFTQPAEVAGIVFGAEWSPTLLPGSWSPLPDLGSGALHYFSLPPEVRGSGFLRWKVTSH